MWNRYHRSNPHCCRDGFSLLDTVLTILLIGLAASVSIPSLNRAQQRYEARCAAAALAADLRYLIGAAATSGTSHAISIDPTSLQIQCATIAHPEVI